MDLCFKVSSTNNCLTQRSAQEVSHEGQGELGKHGELGTGMKGLHTSDRHVLANWEPRERVKNHVGVSKNRGTPKWMVYNGKPY